MAHRTLMAHGTSLHYCTGLRSARASSGVIVVALHAAALAALWHVTPVRSTRVSSAPIRVSLISPPQVAPDVLPKRLEVHARRPAPRPLPQKPAVVTAASEAPANDTVAPIPVAPATQVDAALPAPVVAAPASVPAPSPAPEPMIPPRFNADYLSNPAPAYPPLSRRMGEEGKVVLRVFVNERGLPEDVQVRTSSGSSRLDTTALETVRHWKFVPARRGDSPLAAWVLVPISFSLRS